MHSNKSYILLLTAIIAKYICILQLYQLTAYYSFKKLLLYDIRP